MCRWRRKWQFISLSIVIGLSLFALSLSLIGVSWVKLSSAEDVGGLGKKNEE